MILKTYKYGITSFSYFILFIKVFFREKIKSN
jgi:hypothetical protein